jgi:uncharacterized membrane protein YuzA (DUF378 family)
MGCPKLHILAVVLVLIGAVNWGFIALFGLNLVSVLLPHVGLRRLIYFLIGLSAVFLAANRNTYLPFLGKAALPCSLFHEVTPKGADDEAVIRTKPNVAVVYWATVSNEPDQPIQYAGEAYGKLCNAGVAISDDNGMAVLKVRSPKPYLAGMGFELKPHIHYRVCQSAGMLGPVQTIML